MKNKTYQDILDSCYGANIPKDAKWYWTGTMAELDKTCKELGISPDRFSNVKMVKMNFFEKWGYKFLTGFCKLSSLLNKIKFQ